MILVLQKPGIGGAKGGPGIGGARSTEGWTNGGLGESLFVKGELHVCHMWLLVSTNNIYNIIYIFYRDYLCFYIKIIVDIFITFLSHGAVMCVCVCVCNYIKFYECFLSLEAVCVCLYACRCV